MAAPFDQNFCYPVKTLQSDRLRLIPFEPDKHADACQAALASNPEMFDYLPFKGWSTPEALREWYEIHVRNSREVVLFVGYDTTNHSEGTLASLIGLLNTSIVHLKTEIGFVLTLPAYQRTHVTTHGTGLLLAWCFDELHLRRVQWQTNELNEPSWRAAQRMGFIKEGVLRWDRVLPEGKEGVDVAKRHNDPCVEKAGRHTVMLAVCWDDWEGGAREAMMKRMTRQL